MLDRERADQVQGRAAVLAIERASDRLAIDRDLLGCRGIGTEDRPHPAEETALEARRIDQRQHPAEGVVRGDAVRQREEASQPVLLATAIERDVLKALGLADHGADRDHQDVDQPVLDLPITTRILNRLELVDQRFEHGLPLRREGTSLPFQIDEIDPPDLMRRPCVYTGLAARYPAMAVVVPPRVTAVPSGMAESEPTPRDRHLQHIAEHGRMAWQKASGYTKRARAEAAIGRWKQVIGDRLRAHTDERRATELDVAVHVLNRMLELGRPSYVRLA